MPDPSAADHRRWFVSLAGLGLFVFAVVAASGPGRIDIVDGQTRFEVGRSLVEHGDSALRDSRIWWGSFPGRGGQNYTYYRFPQSVAAAGSVVVADWTGPLSEGRRHFYFVLTSAISAAFLSAFYALGFRRLGLGSAASILWALAGIFCTPNWFYGTSTFDDILGTTTVVAAAVTALATRHRLSLFGAIVAGLLIGLAFNVKQPLAAFLLVIIVLHDDPTACRKKRLVHAAIITLGLLAGMVAQDLYDSYKFPFDKRTVHAELLKQYAPVYAFRPIPALACFVVSPGCGMFWYCPPIVLGMCGVYSMWKDGDRKLAAAILLTSVVFIGFHCFVSFFKGDPAWGPRYLTPWFGVLWLFAPRGAGMLSRGFIGLLLGLGVLVQVLALSVDPHRLFVEKGLSSAAGAVEPSIYFYPQMSHILQRPREIVEICEDKGTAEAYSPAPAPTFTFPIIDPPHLPETGPAVVDRYHVLRSFRPWWISQHFLPKEQRSVDINRTLVLLSALACVGLVMMAATVRFRPDR